jgi:hypothetical protein
VSTLEHDHEAEQGRCSAGDWCTGGLLARNPDGTYSREPAVTPRAFCQACTDRIEVALADMPSAYRRLAAEIGDRPVTGKALRIPFGPRLLLREDVDALMRLMAATLCSWESRVRAKASWTPRDVDKPINTPGAITEAVRVLRELMSVLMAMQPGWMKHTIPFAPGKPKRGAPLPEIPADLEELYGDCEIVYLGVDHLSVMLMLGADDAGNALLKLRSRCLRQLGENRPQPEMFDGIPCRRCGDMGTLERAEPPSDPEKEAMHSRCASCDHAMNLADFQRWARWYGRWADGEGLTCRRCLGKDHGECAYGLCSCPAPVDHPRRRNQAALIACAA